MFLHSFTFFVGFEASAGCLVFFEDAIGECYVAVPGQAYFPANPDFDLLPLELVEFPLPELFSIVLVQCFYGLFVILGRRLCRIKTILSSLLE